MADLVITPASVIAGVGAKIRTGTAGATITAGQIVFRSSVDGLYKLGDADLPNFGLSVAEVFMALNGASTGQPVDVLVSGDVTLNAVLTNGTSYFLSPNPGGIAPRADILTGDFTIFLGTARSSTVLAFQPLIAGQVP